MPDGSSTTSLPVTRWHYRYEVITSYELAVAALSYC